MLKRKKKRTKLLRGCPRCGGRWMQTAGVVRCGSCGHERGSQNPAHGWGGQVEPMIADDDAESTVGDRKGRQDRELKFNG